MSDELAISEKVKVVHDFREYREWQERLRNNVNVFSCRCDKKHGNGSELRNYVFKNVVGKRCSN